MGFHIPIKSQNSRLFTGIGKTNNNNGKTRIAQAPALKGARSEPLVGARGNRATVRMRADHEAETTMTASILNLLKEDPLHEEARGDPEAKAPKVVAGQGDPTLYRRSAQ